MQANQNIFEIGKSECQHMTRKLYFTALQDKVDIIKDPGRSHMEKLKEDYLIPLKIEICKLVYIGIEIDQQHAS